MTTATQFDIFAEAEAAIIIEQKAHAQDIKARAIVRKTSRIEIRRANCEKTLHEILPEKLEMGMSYHVISHGDVDSLSYLIHIVKQQILDSLLCSTWCMAMPDTQWLRDQVENVRIGTIDFNLGEIFPSQYTDEYDTVKQMEADGMCTMKIARNHAKVMAGCHAASGFYFVIESSANINTNPRIEQTAIHCSRELFDQYIDFFAEIKTIDGSRYQKIKA